MPFLMKYKFIYQILIPVLSYSSLYLGGILKIQYLNMKYIIKEIIKND